MDHLVSWRQELAGLLLFVVGFVTLLALFGLTEAGLLVNWTWLLRRLTGWGAYPTVALVALLGLYLILWLAWN